MRPQPPGLAIVLTGRGDRRLDAERPGDARDLGVDLRAIDEHFLFGWLVVSDGLQRDVRDNPAYLLALAVLPTLVDKPCRGSAGRIAQVVVTERGSQKPLTCQRQRDPRRIDSDPAAPPLLCDVCRRPGAARRVKHEIAGIGRHEQAALHDFRIGLNSVELVRGEARSNSVAPLRADRESRKIVNETHITQRVPDTYQSLRILESLHPFCTSAPVATFRQPGTAFEFHGERPWRVAGHQLVSAEDSAARRKNLRVRSLFLGHGPSCTVRKLDEPIRRASALQLGLR